MTVAAPAPGALSSIGSSKAIQTEHTSTGASFLGTGSAPRVYIAHQCSACSRQVSEGYTPFDSRR